MIRKWITRGLPVLGLLGLLVMPAFAGYDESDGTVQRRDGDLSPSVRKSHINNYIAQDEQINVTPLDGVVKVLRTDEKVLVNDYVVKVFPIRNADRREIRDVLRALTSLEGGRAEVFQDKQGSGLSYAEIMAPKFMMPYVEDAIKALDVDWLRSYDDGAGDFYVKMQHRRAADVNRIAEVTAGDSGFSVVDTTNNALRRFDEPYRGEKFANTAALVDIPANQVMLTVKMYEVSASNDLKLGLDYINWKKGPGSNLFRFAEAGYSAEQRAQNQTSRYDPFLGFQILPVTSSKENVLDVAAHESYRAVNYLIPSSFVDFLQTKGQARVISTAEMMLTSTHRGVVSTDNQTLALVNMEEVGDLCYKNVGSTGIHLELIPYVGLESMELDVDLGIGEESSDYFWNDGYSGGAVSDSITAVTPAGLPIINTRTLHTTVRLLDGQPFAIAGLCQVNESEQTAKMPFFGSLPVIGYLFGGETDTKRHSDLVITITPKFYLSSQVNIAKPPVIDTMDVILQTGQQPGSDLEWGFDMWKIGG
jgi:type II secretory pathway component GspD/PulD (secretin)